MNRSLKEEQVKNAELSEKVKEFSETIQKQNKKIEEQQALINQLNSQLAAEQQNHKKTLESFHSANERLTKLELEHKEAENSVMKIKRLRGKTNQNHPYNK